MKNTIATFSAERLAAIYAKLAARGDGIVTLLGKDDIDWLLDEIGQQEARIRQLECGDVEDEPESAKELTLQALRAWLNAQALSWVSESATHKGAPLDVDDEYQRNMALAGYFFWLVSIIDKGELPA